MDDNDSLLGAISDSSVPNSLGEQAPLVPKVEPVAETFSATEPVATELALGSPGVNSTPLGSPTLVVDNVAATKATVDYDAITDALLGSISDLGIHSNFKMMLYGPPGSAKSSWLGEIPNNLVYDFEDGMIAALTAEANSGRPLAPGVQALPFKSLAQADELIDRLQTGHPAFAKFKVFSIDTVSTMHKRMLEFIMRREKAKRPSMNEYDPQTEHYTEVNEVLTRFIQGICDIKDKDIVVLAHAQTVEPKGKPAKTYPDFSEKLSNKLAAKMDIVAYVNMIDIADEQGNKKPTPVFRVVSEGTITAKTRIPLPAEILAPTWQQFKDEFEKARSKGNV